MPSRARKTNDCNDLMETLYTYRPAECPCRGKMVSVVGDGQLSADYTLNRQS